MPHRSTSDLPRTTAASHGSTREKDGAVPPVNEPRLAKTLADCRQSHVVKRLAPDQAGAVKLTDRFGDRLVCVRYRHDPEGQHRYPTVELVVASCPIKHRNPSAAYPRKMQLVAIRLRRQERDLHALLYKNGAVWASDSELWYVPRAIAKALDLLHRVV